MESSLIGFSRGDYSSKTFQAINPADSEKLPTHYAHASDDEVDQACQLAANAALSLSSLSGKEKSVFLEALASGIDEIVDEIVEIMTKETGLPEPRVRAETGRTSGQLRMFAKLVAEGHWVDARIDPAQPQRQPLPKPDLRSMLRPIGPVAVFCASNFPLAFSVAGGDTASALAAGCPVIVKAHHSHPGTALLIGQKIVECMQKCNWPEGSFSLLFGDGRTVGQSLVTHPAVKAVGFTGSRAGGLALFELANKRKEPIPVFAEMSSINPIFVLPSMDQSKFEDFAQGLVGSATLGVGQFCTNPGIVVYPCGDNGDQFVDSYIEKMKDVSVCPMLNQGIKDAYEKGLNHLSNCEGVEVLHREQSAEVASGCGAGTCVLKTQAKDFISDEMMMEEVFGPSTLLVEYDSPEELLQIAEKLDGQLTVSIFGNDSELQEYAALLSTLETKAGRVIFNQFPTGVEVCKSVVHGGPFPATTDSRSTSVGTGAILRFARPVCFQGFPDEWLPDELKDENPLGLKRCEE